MQHGKFFCTTLAIVLVAALWAFPALCEAGAHTSSQSGGIRLSNGLKIISVTPQREAPPPSAAIHIAAEPTPYPQPPLAGFSPLVAITTSDRRSSDDFDTEHVLVSSYVGRPLNAPADDNFVIGVADTGAMADLAAGAGAEMLGLTGRYLTASPAPIGGIGGTVDAVVTVPVGIFAAGLAAVEPDGTLDLSQVVGHTNVCAVAAPPISCGNDEEITAVVGTPLLAFYTTVIRVDQPRKVVVRGRMYIGPDVQLLDSYQPPIQEYQRRIPIELGGLTPVMTATYFGFPNLEDPLGPLEPLTPTLLSMSGFSLPTGALFYTDMGVLHGTAGPLNPLQTMRVMVDTGAQASIMSSNMTARLNLPLEPDFVTQACGTGGLVELPGYYIDYVRINAQGGAMEFAHVPFVVYDLESPEGGTFDGVLGMNFFWNRNVALEPTVGGAGFLHVSDPVPYAYIDLNFDDIVDMTDFAVFASAWRTTPADPAWNGYCDFYLDEVIDARDLQAFIDSWMNMLSQ